jgi:hypothetical protein
MLEGETIGLIEQARLLFDIQVEWAPDDQFVRAHAELERVLPGAGTLAERLAERRRQLEVLPEQVASVLDRIADELRARTARHIALPAGESIELAFVKN